MKYAAFTMDLESFSDNDEISSSGFDVSDPLLDGMDIYLNLLEKNGIRSTLFSLCDAAGLVHDRLKERLAKGHELALHGLHHTEPLTLSDDEFAAQLSAAKAKLEESFGVKIKGFRAPCFSMDNNKLGVLSKLGFSYDSSLMDFKLAYHVGSIDSTCANEVSHGVHRFPGITEFALPIGKFLFIPFPVCGGAYVRLFRWWIMKLMIRNYIRKHNFFVFYLHPYEIANRLSPAADKFGLGMRFYLKRGILKYPAHIQEIIDLLRKEGYEFRTLGELNTLVSE